MITEEMISFFEKQGSKSRDEVQQGDVFLALKDSEKYGINRGRLYSIHRFNRDLDIYFYNNQVHETNICWDWIKNYGMILKN